MIRNRSLRKTVAYALIAALLNPAAMLPAYALDTDIFLNPPTGSVFGEPNIMIVLDTSDSMWIPEPWHEVLPDEAAYDSHYEYLWNDTAFIHSIGCNVAGCGSGGDQYTSATKNLPRFPDYDPAMASMPQGFFVGDTAAARGALKQTAATWAAGTNASDPGSRNIYRNYGGGATSNVGAAPIYDSSWAYWLPAGTPDTDLRLMSTSPSRAPLGSRVSRFSNSNGIDNDPVTRGGIQYGNASDNAFDNFNLVTLSYRQARTGANRCTSSYSQLLPSTVYAPGPYAKNGGVWLNKQWVRYEPFLELDDSRVADFPSRAAGDDARAQWVLAPYWSGTMDTSPNHLGVTPASAPMMDHSFFPIRTARGSSRAGWTTLRTDLAGYIPYRDWLFNAADSGTNNTILLNTLAAFGITSNAAQARVRGAVRTFETGAHQVSTTKFPTCTDAASCALAGVSLGIPAYYDEAELHPNPTLAPAPTVCAWSPSDGRLNAGPDAKTASRLYRSGPPGSATNPDCVKVSGPGTCVAAGGSQWSPNDNKDSRWTGRQTLPLINEGLSTTYYHGGTCEGRCTYGAGDIAQCPVGANASPGPTNPSSFAPANTYSAKGVEHASLVVNRPPLAPITLNDVRTDSPAAGCSDNADAPVVACSTKTPGCVDVNYGLICTPVPPPGTNVDAFKFAAGDAALVHDCLDDNGVTDFNPGNSYIRRQDRTFGTAYNTNSAPGDAAHSYSTSSGHAIGSAPAVDMYSVNYLNWKYGPKGPNNLPIARKTRMQIAKDALATLVERTNGVRYGLMVFNGLPADAVKQTSEGSQGARVVFPITRMGTSPTDTPDAANRAELIKRIFAQEARAATPLTESVYEAMLYFSGRAPRFGTNAAINTNFGASSLLAQGGGNVADGADPNALCTAVGTQCPAIGTYKSPMLNNPTTAAPASCQRNFMVVITDGNADRDRDANAQIKNTTWAKSATVNISARTTIDSTQPDTTTDQFETGGLPYGPISTFDTAFDGGYVWLDELASFMNRADLSPGARIFSGDSGTDLVAGDQPVKLFTIGFAGVNSPVLTNSATGDFKTAESSADLVKALEAAVNNARTSNAIVAAPTIPISASNRAENSDDVYLSFFKPDTTRTWNGTVKKYKLGLHALDPGICGNDASGNPIQVCLTGQTDTCGVGCKNIEKVTTQGTPPVTTVSIDPASVSFWSSPATPDGGQPDQGGTAFVLKNTTGETPATRRVYTHLSSQTDPALTANVNKVLETNTTLTKCLLGDAAACADPTAPTMSDTARTTLINYIRGGDPGAASCTTPGTPCSVWRNFAHAGVLHSSPTVVTYTATEQLVFYLSVDGLLHAVDAATGQEKWAFLVEEALPQLSALMANTSGRDPIQIADGSISFFHKDHNGDGIVNNLGGTDQVLLFFGLRRGGRAYYALDVTDSTSPVFKWKITNTQVCVGAAACGASPYTRLGQTWSKPIVARLHASAVVASGFPALVFGGGYDPNQDTDPVPAVGTDTMGNALFVVNMTDGSLVKEFSNGNVTGGMLSAIPSDPAVLNANLDSLGFADRIYVGDVAGNLYRFDVDNADVSAWTGKKLAVLSDTSPPNRKIFFPPVVVKQSVTSSSGVTQNFDAVYVGTGDREHPLNLEVAPGVAVSDKMFMVKDPDIGLTADLAYVAVFPTDFVSLGVSSAAGVSVDDLQSAKGWARDLNTGEKVTGPPQVFGDRVRFGTYIPEASNVCATGGESRLNELNATTGDFTLTTAAGTPTRFQQGTSSTYLSGTMTILRGGKYYTVTFAPAGGGGQTEKVVLPSDITAAPGLGRVYWYMEPEL